MPDSCLKSTPIQSFKINDESKTVLFSHTSLIKVFGQGGIKNVCGMIFSVTFSCNYKLY